MRLIHNIINYLKNIWQQPKNDPHIVTKQFTKKYDVGFGIQKINYNSTSNKIEVVVLSMPLLTELPKKFKGIEVETRFGDV